MATFNESSKKIHKALVAAGSVKKGGCYLCPVHEVGARKKHNPSLSFDRGAEPGLIVLTCAKCPIDQVLEALDLTYADLRYDEDDPEPVGQPAIFAYPNADGQKWLRVVRQGMTAGRPKTHQERWTGKRWVKGLGKPQKQRVLYRLPHVLKHAAKGRTLHLTEGESDADALNAWFKDHRQKQFATSHPEGAGKWRNGGDAYARSLAGAARLVVWADRDAPGYACAEQRFSALREAGHTVEIRLPIPDHKGADVREHLEAGHTPDDGKQITHEECEALRKEAAALDRGDDEDRVLTEIRALFLADNDQALDHLADVFSDEDVQALPDPEYVIEKWVPRGLYSMLYGAPGVGKTFALLGMSRAVRRGTRWQDNETTKGAVLFYQGEGLAQLKPRTRAWDDRYPLREDQSMEPVGFLDRLVDVTKPEGVAAIVRTVQGFERRYACKVEMVIIDPLVEFMTGDENGDGMNEATKGLRALAAFLDIAVVTGHHTNASGERARGADFHRMRAGAFMQMENLPDGLVGIWQQKQKNAEAQAVILRAVEHADSLLLEWTENTTARDYVAQKESETRSRKKEAKAAESSERRELAQQVLTEVVRDGEFDQPKERSENQILARAMVHVRERDLVLGRPTLKETLLAMRDPYLLDVIRTEQGSNGSTLHYWKGGTDENAG